MKRLGWMVLGVLVAVSGPAFAQQTPDIAPGWRKVEGAIPAYVNSATRMVCPEKLSDGYAIVGTSVYQSTTDVSCAYGNGAGSLVSFNFYPASGTAQDELNSSSRVLLARIAPGIMPTQGQRTWNIAGAASQPSSLELVDPRGLGQSFTIADVAGRRIKARETWSGDGAISHRVADGFFAQQGEAIANARTCAALPTWPTTRKARLTADPFGAALEAAATINTLAALPAAESTAPDDKSCILASLGQTGSGSNVLLRRSGPSGVSLALDDQPASDVLAGLAAIGFEGENGRRASAVYALYSQKGAKFAVYRTYRTLPSFDQIQSDLTLVVTNELASLITTEPKMGEPGISLGINADEADKEKAKRRPGSR